MNLAEAMDALAAAQTESAALAAQVAETKARLKIATDGLMGIIDAERTTR